MKIKESLEKPGIFWLRFTILDAWDMSNGFMTNRATALSLRPSKKTEVFKLWEDIMDFYH